MEAGGSPVTPVRTRVSDCLALRSGASARRVSLRQNGAPAPGFLALQPKAPRPSPWQRSQVPARGAAAAVVVTSATVAALASLATQDCLQNAVAHLQRVEPKFVPLVAAQGLPDRLLSKTTSCFGALAKSVVYQQLTGKAAATILGRVVIACESDCPETLSPERLLAVPLPELRACGLSERKAAYVTGLAQLFVSGTLADAAIRGMEDAQLMVALTAINGVGPWTADMFSMFHLGRPDVLPVGDLAVRKGMQAMYGLAKLPSPKEMEELAEHWRPFRSVGTAYMWGMPEASVRTPGVKKSPADPRGAPKKKRKVAGAAAAATGEEATTP